MSEETTRSLVALEDVTVGYGRLAVLGGISMEVSRGDFFALIGPNGAGKSTVLKTMLGSLRPLKGKLKTRPGLRVGYVPQRTRIDPIFPLTALEVVRSGGMGPKGRGKKGTLLSSAPLEDARRAMKRLGVEHLANIPLRDLSGGQQQRTLIARALVREPDLLVLDEPTAGMDIPSESELLDFVCELNRDGGPAVILVVHRISLAAGRASKMAVINKDLSMFATGSSEDLLQDHVLSELYGRPMAVVRGEGGNILTVRTAQGDAP